MTALDLVAAAAQAAAGFQGAALVEEAETRFELCGLRPKRAPTATYSAELRCLPWLRFAGWKIGATLREARRDFRPRSLSDTWPGRLRELALQWSRHAREN